MAGVLYSVFRFSALQSFQRKWISSKPRPTPRNLHEPVGSFVLFALAVLGTIAAEYFRGNFFDRRDEGPNPPSPRVITDNSEPTIPRRPPRFCSGSPTFLPAWPLANASLVVGGASLYKWEFTGHRSKGAPLPKWPGAAASSQIPPTWPSAACSTSSRKWPSPPVYPCPMFTSSTRNPPSMPLPPAFHHRGRCCHRQPWHARQAHPRRAAGCRRP